MYISLKPIFILFSALFFLNCAVPVIHAEEAVMPQKTPAAAKKKKHSKKEYDAESKMKLPQPQVVKEGDSLLGLRISKGSTFEGGVILGADYEYLFHPNFGMGAFLRHSSYSIDFSNIGKWSYTVWALGAHGSIHADVFKVQNLDTYLNLGLGRAFLSSKWESASSSVEPLGAEASSFFLFFNANARYFFHPQWAAHASLGYGLGIFGVGIDYLF